MPRMEGIVFTFVDCEEMAEGTLIMEESNG